MNSQQQNKIDIAKQKHINKIVQFLRAARDAELKHGEDSEQANKAWEAYYEVKHGC